MAFVPRRAAVFAVRCYQVGLSPLLPLFFGGGCGCRFHPTCSHYAIGALERHGLLAGCYLAARRLLRCHPLHPGGEDPVPASFRWLPRPAPGSFVFSASRAGAARLNRTHG